MQIPVVGAWVFTATFLLLTYPCLRRLVRLDYARLGIGVQQIDLSALLMTVAMMSMASPIGAPIPVAGWQALFLLTACWFAVGAVRGRSGRGVSRGCDLHHGLGALGMLYMFVAMPHADAGHGAWPNMIMPDGGATMAWPVVAVLGAVYFGIDGVWAGVQGLRSARAHGAGVMPPGSRSRNVCRVVTGFGMAGMLVAGL